MKKTLRFVILSVLLIFALTALLACGDKNTDDKNTAAPDDYEKINASFSDMQELLNLDFISEDTTEDIFGSISKIDFSVQDLMSDGEAEEGYLVFKNNTLYLSEDGQTASQVTKLFKHGLLIISETEEGVTSSMQPFISEDQGINADLSIDKLFEDMKLTEDDLLSTETEGLYKLSRNYIRRVAKLLLGGEDGDLSGIDLAAITVSADLRELSEKGKIIFTAGTRTDSDLIKLELTVTEADGVSSGKLVITINPDPSSVTITLDVARGEDGKTEIDLDIDTCDGSWKQTNVNFKAIVEGNLPRRIEFRMSGDNTMSLVCNIQKRDNDGAYEVYALDASLYIDSKDGDINLSAESVLWSNDDGLAAAELTLKLTQKNDRLDVAISYDGSRYKAPGARVIVGNISESVDGDNKSLSFFVETVHFASDTQEYCLTFTNESESGSVATAAIHFPAKKQPKVSEKANPYLHNGSAILENYPAYLKTANKLNKEITDIIASGDLSYIKSAYVTYDQILGIYYITKITNTSSGYVASTYSSPDAFRIGYSYPKNNGGFLNSSQSQAQADLDKLFSFIQEDVPSDTATPSGKFWAYTYIQECDLYLLTSSSSIYDASIMYEKPSEEELGKKLHEIVYNNEGDGSIHSFETTYSYYCQLVYYCTHCRINFIEYDVVEHDYDVNITHAPDGRAEWKFRHCTRCTDDVLELYTDSGTTVYIPLRRVSYPERDELQSVDGFDDYDIETDKHLMVIESIRYDESKITGSLPFIIDIPDISKYCDYKIIAVGDGIANSHSSIPCRLILPQSVKFVFSNSFAGIQSITSVSMPSVIFIGDNAFKNCSKLSDVEIGNSLEYIGNNAFDSCGALESIWVRDELNSSGEEGVYQLPESLRIIGASAFRRTPVRSVNIPSSITELVSETFAYCRKLESVSFDGDIEMVGYAVFIDCILLENIILPNSVTVIGNSAFKGCVMLKEEAFAGCENLVSIGALSFALCTGLKNVVIPQSVTSFGDAFVSCELDSLRFECVFKFNHIFNPIASKTVTYANEIEETIMFCQVTNILSTELPEDPDATHHIRGDITVNFAGSEEEFIAAGYVYDDSVTVNFNVSFEE